MGKYVGLLTLKKTPYSLKPTTEVNIIFFSNVN